MLSLIDAFHLRREKNAVLHFCFRSDHQFLLMSSEPDLPCTHPRDRLDSPDNLEQQFAEAPGWKVGSRVLDAQTQQVGSCQLVVVTCKFNTGTTLKNDFTNKKV